MKRLIAAFLNRFFHSAAGQRSASLFLLLAQYRVFSSRTVHAMRFDLLRLAARRQGAGPVSPRSDRLHLGCGDRRVPGWLNVDVTGSDLDLDLAAGRLPFPSAVFSVVVSQHTVEHLELHDELIPLLREVRRAMRPDGEIWLSCPDMAKVCRSYLDDHGGALLKRTLARTQGTLPMGEAPSQHYINLIFDQTGEHRNLFDFELLQWALTTCGFTRCRQMQEADFLARFPEFPPRNDDYHTLYVQAFS